MLYHEWLYLPALHEDVAACARANGEDEVNAMLNDRSFRLSCLMILAVVSATWTNHAFGSAATNPDAFGNPAGQAPAPSATVYGKNNGYTREVGEPFHYANQGGRSAWIDWVAPASGL